MIKRLYLFFHSTVVGAIALVVLAFLILTNSYFVPYFAEKYLKEFGVEYSHVEGSIFNHITIEDVKYGEFVKLKSLRVNYNFLYLLQTTPKISKITVDALELNLNKLPSSDTNSSSSSAIAFIIKNIELKNTKIIFDKEEVSFDFKAKNLHYDKQVDIEKLLLDLNTSYAHVTLNAKLLSNKIMGKVSLKPSQSIQEKYLGFLADSPLNFKLYLDATEQKVLAKIDVENLRVASNTKFKDIALELEYAIAQKELNSYVTCDFIYPDYKVKIAQKLHYKNDENFTSELNATLAQTPIPLPFHTMHVTTTGDTKSLVTDVDAGKINLHVTTKDYKKYALNLRGKDMNLSFLKELPKEIQEQNLSLNASATLDTSNALNVEGKLLVDNTHVTLKTAYKIDDKKLALQTHISPGKKLLKEFKYERVDINTTLLFESAEEIENSISVPWVSIKTDSQNTEVIKDISMSVVYTDKKIKVKRYSAEYMEQKIYSERESLLSLDENNSIIFDEFWIYDNLLVKGKVKTADKSVDVTLQSEKFDYVAEDINISVKADLHLLVDANATQNIQGEILLLNGVTSYSARNDYKISDKDIIILQDKKKKENSKRFVDIKIKAKKPIHYKTKEADIEFVPDLRVVEKPGESLRIFGDVTILEGTLSSAGKEFKVDKSYVIFDGAEELNPKLNIHLHYYTLDYIDIEIFITHTLTEPIVIFSSNPAMSQNDIMSYILFGERANSVFDGSSNKTSVNALLLGTGLSQMFSDTSGVNIDTLNILNNQDGTLGYEVGARFNKNMRVVYKSDTTSSVVLQYSISKSVRFDVDTHETGQGVGFVYVKDFSIH